MLKTRCYEFLKLLGLAFYSYPVFEKEDSNKVLISEIYKQLIQLNITKKKKIQSNWGEDLNRYF